MVLFHYLRTFHSCLLSATSDYAHVCALASLCFCVCVCVFMRLCTKVFQTEQRARTPDQNIWLLMKPQDSSHLQQPKIHFRIKALNETTQIFMTKDVQLVIWREHIILIIVMHQATLCVCAYCRPRKLITEYSSEHPLIFLFHAHCFF